MTGTIYHSEDEHPQDLRRELNPDASQGRNHGLVGKRPEKDNPRTASDI
jgi:hypothetical protein